MLALVHPAFTPSTSEVPHRTPSATPSASRSRQPSRNKAQSALPVAQAASSNLPSSSSASTSEGSSALPPSSSSSAVAAGAAPQPLSTSHPLRPSHSPRRTSYQASTTSPPSSTTCEAPRPEVFTASHHDGVKLQDEPLPRPAVDIHSYPSQDLLRLLASLLSQIAATNDKLHSQSSPDHPPPSSSPNTPRTPSWHKLTTASQVALDTPSATLSFHARNVPTISLEAYLTRILKYCPTTNEVFLSLLVYFDRMSKLSVDLTTDKNGSKIGGKAFVIDSYNVHRLVIAGVTVASKFFSDVFYTNSRYAKVGGLPQSELNQLELQFLLLNDFDLVIPNDEMQRYADQLVAFADSGEHPNSTSPPIPTIAVPPHARVQESPVYLQRAAAMGAVDAYAGPIPHPTIFAANTTAPTPSQPFVGAARTSSTHASQSGTQLPMMMRGNQDESDAETETDNGDTETEGGWTTDDEPTIRPPNSNSSEDAQSICSTGTEDDPQECEDTHMDNVDRTPERVVIRDGERTPDAVPVLDARDHNMERS